MKNEKIIKKIIKVISILLFVFPLMALAQDLTGANTLAANANAPLDFAWVIIMGSLVMFMQAGFALVESGFCRVKNVLNLIAKNIIDFALGSLIFMAVGFAFMFGTDHSGIIGSGGWFLTGENYDVGRLELFFFQLMFAATAATIVSGAVAERIKFKAYLFYTIAVSAIIYPIYGHWVWGGGWLANLSFGLGHLDFAGSGVVHVVGGIVGLTGAMVLGARKGRFDNNGNSTPIAPHSILLAALGTLILWFGWLGFNTGSTLSAHELRISLIAVNTTLAGAAGSVAAMLFMYAKTKKWNVSMMLNGALAGLVAVTAPCAWVTPGAAVIIGAIGGLVMIASSSFLEKRKIDDPVGAVSVHGAAGLWGLLSVGFFADGTYGNYTTDLPHAVGLFYGGGFDQLIAQAIGIVIVFAWAFITGFVLFKLMDKWFGIRVSVEEEEKGLDIFEHEGTAYPYFSVSHSIDQYKA